MVVKEGDQIDPSVLALEHEGKEIGLPELIGPCRTQNTAGGWDAGG